MRLGPYVLQEEITRDQSSRLWKAIDSRDDSPVVIKLPPPGTQQTKREASALSQFRHPHIIRMLESFDTADGPAIVLPFARGGDLLEVIATQPIPETDMKQIAYRLLDALSYLHGNNVIHRDVKPENMFVMTRDLSADGVVLADFGFARQCEDGVCGDEFCGSPCYSAPELVERDPYTTKVDMWAFGITLCACLTRRFPFKSRDRQRLFGEIAGGLPVLKDPTYLKDISEHGRDLIRQLLQVDPSTRISADQALDHPWFDDVRHEPAGQECTRSMNLTPVDPVAVAAF
jgi:serine/threonine protein kinase